MTLAKKVYDTCGLEIVEGTDAITFGGYHTHATRTILTQAILGGEVR